MKAPIGLLICAAAIVLPGCLFVPKTESERFVDREPLAGRTEPRATGRNREPPVA